MTAKNKPQVDREFILEFENLFVDADKYDDSNIKIFMKRNTTRLLASLNITEWKEIKWIEFHKTAEGKLHLVCNPPENFMDYEIEILVEVSDGYKYNNQSFILNLYNYEPEINKEKPLEGQLPTLLVDR